MRKCTAKSITVSLNVLRKIINQEGGNINILFLSQKVEFRKVLIKLMPLEGQCKLLIKNDHPWVFTRENNYRKKLISWGKP